MLSRRLLGVLVMVLVPGAACSKNDGRSPGILEGVANDVENEIDGAGDSVDGVGKDVTNTLDGTSPSPPPPSEDAAGDEESAEEAPAGD